MVLHGSVMKTSEITDWNLGEDVGHIPESVPFIVGGKN